MHSSSFQTLPHLFLILVLLFGLLIVVLQIGILGYAYEKMGISRRAAYTILFLSLVGSYINIPIAELQGEPVMTTRLVRDSWGFVYQAPVLAHWSGTILAVNVGGAVIPTILSFYLVAKNQIFGPAVVGVAVVAAVVHMLAEPVEHMGIAVPIFIPPIVSAIVAMFLSRDYAAPLAYVSGCMGTLIGADITNLDKLGSLGASIASIGGAGTFDGVFLTGVLAVLLAVSPAPRRTADWQAPPAEQPREYSAS